MKKTVIITFLCSFMLNAAMANAIDSLNTIADVNKFLIEKVDSNWRMMTFFNKNDIGNTPYGKNNFFKLDINHDGRTDLVINALFFLVITDNGNGTYRAHFVYRGEFNLARRHLMTIIDHKNSTLLITQPFYPFGNEIDPRAKPDTLIYKFRASLKTLLILSPDSYRDGEDPIAIGLKVRLNKKPSF